MEIDISLWPVPRETLAEMVKYAKSMPTLVDARPHIGLLEHCFRGINNSEAFKMIDSITHHFKKEADEERARMTKECVEEFMRVHLHLPQHDVTDEQVAAAIVQTATNVIMESKRDWGGFYIILSGPECKWTTDYKDFERKVKRLKDEGLLKHLPKDKDFSYVALQQGIQPYWPKTYIEWLKKTDGGSVLEHRREVATKFLNNLKDLIQKDSTEPL
jgi:hypothetical protein